MPFKWIKSMGSIFYAIFFKIMKGHHILTTNNPYVTIKLLVITRIYIYKSISSNKVYIFISNKTL